MPTIYPGWLQPPQTRAAAIQPSVFFNIETKSLP